PRHRLFSARNWPGIGINPAIPGNNMTMPKPLRAYRRIFVGPVVRTLAVLLACMVAGALPAAEDPAKAEAELKAVRAQMEKVRAEMQRDASRRDKLTRELEE